MKFDVDLATGTVQAEFSLNEAQEILAALQAVRNGTVMPKPASAPPMWKMAVPSESDPDTSYETRIWFGFGGEMHYACQCGDAVYRKRFCKHLQRSNKVRVGLLAGLS